MPAQDTFYFLFVGLTVLGLVEPAQSQQWPQKPVKIIVPFAPGGNTDGIARLLGQRLNERFHQPFVIENNSGATGALAAQYVARASADGHTLIMATMSLIAILPATQNVSFDPVNDFAPISNIGTTPVVLLINPRFPAMTLKEFVTNVRIQPGKLSYASGGIGSFQHLSMALLLKQAGIDMIHVPYRGGGPAIADVVAGHVSAYFGPLPEALPQVRGGTVRALAISENRRNAQLPDVPTVSESGYPDFRLVGWNGLLAPAATPREIVEKIGREVQLTVKDRDFVVRAREFGIEPLGNSPNEFAAMISMDIALWADAVAIAGIKVR